MKNIIKTFIESYVDDTDEIDREWLASFTQAFIKSVENRNKAIEHYDEEQYVYQARIAVDETAPWELNPELSQTKFGGIMISKSGQPDISKTKQWENIQCEITIKPLKRFGEYKIKNTRIDHAMLALSDEEYWVK